MGTSKLRGTPKVMLGGDLGLASHPGGRGNTTSCFMLRKRDKFWLGGPIGLSVDLTWLFQVQSF